jgi:hypothetical protein
MQVSRFALICRFKMDNIKEYPPWELKIAHVDSAFNDRRNGTSNPEHKGPCGVLQVNAGAGTHRSIAVYQHDTEA